MSTKLEKFTSRCSKVLEVSKAHAGQLGKKEAEPKDLFWALTQVKGSLALEILNKSGFKGLDFSASQSLAKTAKNCQNNKIDKNYKDTVSFSPKAKRVIEKSVAIAADMNHFYVGTEHLLFALLNVNDREIDKILLSNKIDKKKILEQLKVVFQATLNFSEMINVIHKASELSAISEMEGDDLLGELIEERELSPKHPAFRGRRIVKPGEVKDKRVHQPFGQKKQKTPLLDYFGRNLTDEKNQKMIDPVIGREKEISRIIQILLRRNKNNPVLLGEPGVGKTAIVEGLAKKIIDAEVPDVLLNKKIYALDINLLVAGAVMRGEFEARLKQIIDEVKGNPDIIIFIDELHNIIGAGSVTGTMDAANILKPALARGELRCIGATTYEEYKKHIEEDAALERRFQPVQIPEPSVQETISILNGIKHNYEKHHRVKITSQAIEAAANLSDRYLPEKFLPDKAIDLIDEAAARIKINSKVVDEDLRRLKLLESKIKAINLEKQKQVSQENYPQALKLKEEEAKLYDLIYELEDKMFSKEDRWLGKVTAKDVAELVSEMTKVPLGNLITLEKNKILNLEKALAKRIVGQSEVLKELASYLKRARAGLSGQNRPLGSFMFLGPSGVGKTETAKVLAEEMFAGVDKKGSLIRFDMSEFAESFNLSRLIGSPAGYVGYKEGGRLTEAVRRNPYSVVLFDEIEKAHPEIFNILLQILEDGILSDATGKEVNFKNTVIILTSNLGTEKLDQPVGFGEENHRDRLRQPAPSWDRLEKQVKETFRPEFLNRLDKILIFKPLDLKSIEKIVELQLNELANNLKKGRKIRLSWSKRAVAKLAEASYSPESGARNVRRMIEEKVGNELAERILGGEIKTGQGVEISWQKKGLEFKLRETRTSN